MTKNQKKNGPMHTWQAKAFFALLVLAGILRIGAALNDFWLDEIWSYNIAREIDSVLDLVTSTPHDNNHILNTLYLYILGYQTNWVWYRLLSIVTGTAAVGVMGMSVWRQNPLEAVVIVWLSTVSFPLIVYSSEARGYAPVVLFAMLSFTLIQHYRQYPKIQTLLLFWLTTILGLLSHLTYCYIYLAILFWSFFRTIESDGDGAKIVKKLIKIHLVPVMFALFLYLVHVRHLVIGGGPVLNLSEVIGSTILMALGLFANGPVKILGISAFCLIILYGTASLKKRGDDRWLFFFFALLLAPALVIAIMKPQYLYPRYFLVCFPFFYLLLGHSLTHLYQNSAKVGRFIALAIFIGYSIGHLYLTAQFLATGRGGYLKALYYMAEHNNGPNIQVGSDHDFRNMRLLAFYASYLPKGYRVIYHNRDAWPEGGPKWMITHSLDPKHKPPASMQETNKQLSFSLEKIYRYSGISGWNWHLYRNVVRDEPAQQ